jgi:hypothetical protein
MRGSLELSMNIEDFDSEPFIILQHEKTDDGKNYWNNK